MMRLSRVVPLLLVLLSAPTAWAAEPDPWNLPRFQATAAEMRQRANEAPVPVGADVEMLLDEMTAVVDAQRKWVKQYYQVYRILTPRGASEWDSVGVSWAPWYQDRPLLEARVVGPDSQIHWLSAETVEESSPTDDSGKIYSDRKQLRAPLPAVAVGSIVEQRITIRDNQARFEAGTVDEYLFGNWVPTRASRLVVEAPAALPLRYGTALLPKAAVRKSESGGTVRLLIEQGSLPAWTSLEPYLAPELPRRPTVTVSTAADWKAVASQYSKVVDQKIGTGGKTPLLPAITKGSGTKTEKIDALVRWIAKEIRYTGIEFGDSAIIPHTPQETLARKFGDCKDKATLLVALLREAGIPAGLALLSSGSGQDVSPDFPGLGRFDHAIVHIPGTPPRWIDPTDEFSRPHQLPISDQGRLTLVAAENTVGLTVIPRAAPEENLLLRTREVAMAAYGKAKVKETWEGSGYLESWHRSFFSEESDQGRMDWAKDYTDNEFLSTKVDLVTVSDPADLTKPMAWTMEVSEVPRGETGLRIATLWVRYEQLFERLPEMLRTESEDETPRTHDVVLPQGFVTEIRLRIVPPEAFTPTLVPEGRSVALGPALLTESFSKGADGVITGFLRFETGTPRYTAAQAGELRTKILDLVARDPLQFRFEPVTQVLWDQGNLRDAFTRHQKLTSVPGPIGHRLRYANALFDLGLGDAARSEARSATEAAPESALAWQLQAELLKSDSVGREYRPGSDWDGAAAAYDRARTLSPEDQDLTGNSAILHEYNRDGSRYGAGAPLDRAIALYREMGEKGRESAQLDTNLAFALFYAGDYRGAVQEARRLNDPPAVVLVAGEALLVSPSSAVALAGRLVTQTVQRAETLRTAGNMVMNARRYSEASALLQAGAQGSSASQTAGLAAILAKTKPYGDPALDKDGPASPVRRLMAYLIQDLTISPKIEAQFSPGIRTLLSADRDNSLLTAVSKLAMNLRQWGLSRTVLTDLVLQLLQTKVDGSDKTGYRVKMSVQGGEQTGFYVVKSLDGYLIADSTADAGMCGPELLDRLRSGDLAGVRQALDWFRDEMPTGNGDDPASQPPFARYWKRGLAADEKAAARAVAFLMSRQKGTAVLAAELLRRDLPTLPEGPDRDLSVLALLEASLLQEEYAEAVPLAEEALRRNPGSQLVLTSAVRAYIGSRQTDKAIALTLPFLDVDDQLALGLQAEAYSRAGRYREADSVWSKLVASGEARPFILNNAAWNTLFLPGTEERGLDLALAAVRTEQTSPGHLHTAAALLAVNGKVAEAKDTMVKAMDLEGLDTPDASYLLLQGLLAEQVGLDDWAVYYYKQVTPPTTKYAEASDSYQVAQNHLKALEKRTR